MTFIDLFAGVGGFRRGMELAGHKCMGFCEWDKFATASYTSMHLITDEQRKKLAGMSLKERQKEIMKDEYRNGEWYSPDIRQVGAGNVPRVDCWCFGAPCQDFSIAGKRAGLDGDRSSLVREVFRVLGELEEEDRPEWLIYENVKGMLSSNRGGDFLSIILAMEELGYDIEWQVFNSKYHGVPQNRERVYTLGHLRTRGERKVFPLRGAAEEDSVQRKINIIGHRDGYRRNTQTFDYNGITEALDTAAGGGREQHTAIPLHLEFNKDYNQKNVVHTPLEESRTLTGQGHTGNEPKVAMFGIDYNTSGHEREIANALTTRNNANGVENVNQDGTAVCIPVLTPDRAEKRQNGRRFKDNGEESFTLTAQDRHGVGLKCIGGLQEHQRWRNDGISPCLTSAMGMGGGYIPVIWYEKYNCYIAIRKLTPRECFRLQGWTDDYFEKAQFVNSDSQLYKQAGNGVTVNVVEDIARMIG